MKGKKGFGAVQMIAIVLLALTGLVLFLMMLFINIADPVSQWGRNDMPNSYADAVLDNMLALPMKNPPETLTETLENPTISDYLAVMGSSSDEKELLEDEVNAALDPLDHFSDWELHYEFRFRNINAHDGNEFFDSFGRTKYNEICARGGGEHLRKTAETTGLSSALIQTAEGAEEVTLGMCVSWRHENKEGEQSE